MAKSNLNEKAGRTLRLLMGLRNRQVANQLVRYGFTGVVLDEGWNLLRAVSPSSAPIGRPRSETDATIRRLEGGRASGSRSYGPCFHVSIPR